MPVAPLLLLAGSPLQGQKKPEKFFVCFWGVFSEPMLLDSKFRVVAAGMQRPAVAVRVQLCDSLSTILKMPHMARSLAFLSDAGSARR